MKPIEIKCERLAMPDGRFVAIFESKIPGEISTEALPTVPLARVPDHCFFRIDRLHEHSGYTPIHGSKELCDSYIHRVFNDIKNALSVQEIKTEVNVIDGKVIFTPVGLLRVMSQN